MVKELGFRDARLKCKQVYDKFHAENPEIKKFHTQLDFNAARNGFLISPFGRIRKFPNPKQLHNEILAFPGQSVAVDVLIRNAILPLPGLLDQFGGRLLFTVHDSVVCQFDARYLREVDELVQKTMEAPLTELNNWSIPTERKYGWNWGELYNIDRFRKQELDAISTRTA
jgi:DNA polymerase I-like protein with 3'-5' exonuclease and polymerase domains